jgi:hypothetical protein
MTRGIYEIRNTRTGECYIGSATNIARRWADHRKHLNRGTHVNHRLQDGWDADGEESFSFSVIEEIPPPAWLLVAESRLIAERNPAYNIGRLPPQEEPAPLEVPPYSRSPGISRIEKKTEFGCDCGYAYAWCEVTYPALGTKYELYHVTPERKRELKWTIVLDLDGTVRAWAEPGFEASVKFKVSAARPEEARVSTRDGQTEIERLA